MNKLNIDMPEIICRATKHIGIMEKYVKKIIENGYTYEGSVVWCDSELDLSITKIDATNLIIKNEYF